MGRERFVTQRHSATPLLPQGIIAFKKLPCGVLDHWQRNTAKFLQVGRSFVFIVDTDRDMHAQIPVVEARPLLHSAHSHHTSKMGRWRKQTMVNC